MAFKRFQNSVAESRFLLPLSALITAGACYLSGLVTDGLWMQLVCLALSVVLVVELNNTHLLLRVPSLSTPSFLLLLTAVAIFIFPDLRACIIQLCGIAVYFTLFHCEQRRPSPGWVFYGFFCIGLASMVWVQMLYYVPVMWLLMATHLRAMTAKTFWASVLGLLAPYWIGMGYYLYQGGVESLGAHFAQLWAFGALGDYSMLNEHHWLAIGWTVLLAFIGIVHYIRKGYQDKIRTRLLTQIFIVVDVLSIAFLFLQPQHYPLLMALIIVNTAPLVAHFITLTHTWLTNMAFFFIIVITLAIIFYNVWMPSSNFLSVTATQVCSYLPL
jgi:hypothetical protein